jgi:hypothetical protein
MRELRASDENYRRLFSIERIETLGVYDDLPENGRKEIARVLGQAGYNTDHESECNLVIVANRSSGD